MNKKRLKKIENITRTLYNVNDFLEDILDEEKDAYYSYPENLQNTDTYFIMEDSVDKISDAISYLKDTIDVLEDI